MGITVRFSRLTRKYEIVLAENNLLASVQELTIEFYNGTGLDIRRLEIKEQINRPGIVSSNVAAVEDIAMGTERTVRMTVKYPLSVEFSGVLANGKDFSDKLAGLILSDNWIRVALDEDGRVHYR